MYFRWLPESPILTISCLTDPLVPLCAMALSTNQLELSPVAVLADVGELNVK